MELSSSVSRHDPVTIFQGAREAGVTVQWRIVFVSGSMRAAPTPDTVWINIGRTVGDGVVNFRTTGSSARGSAECMFQQQASIFAHLLQTRPPSGSRWPITVVFAREWKPDDVAAYFLLQRLVEDGQLPSHAAEFAEYTANCRQSPDAICPLLKEKEARLTSRELGQVYSARLLRDGSRDGITLHLALLSLQHRLQALPNQREVLTESRKRHDSEEMINRLVRTIALASSTWLEHPQSNPPKWYDFDMQAGETVEHWADSAEGVELGIRTAVCHALGDLRDAAADGRYCTVRKIRDVCIPYGDDLSDRAKTWALWVDEKGPFNPLLRSAYGAGIICADAGDGPPPVIVIHNDVKGRFEITISPAVITSKDERIPSLRTLGRVLEACEQCAYAEQQRTDPRRSANARFADIPAIADPWYDGRDHDFNLVGSPRYQPSLLKCEDIEAILRSKYWLPPLKEYHYEIYRPEPGKPSEWTKSARSSDTGKLHRIDPNDSTLFPSSVDDRPFRVIAMVLSPDVVQPLADSSSVDVYVGPMLRAEVARLVCGPAPRTVPLEDPYREADVGTDGVVVWLKPRAEGAAVDECERLASTAREVLEYQKELEALREGARSTTVEEPNGLTRGQNRGGAQLADGLRSDLGPKAQKFPFPWIIAGDWLRAVRRDARDAGRASRNLKEFVRIVQSNGPAGGSRGQDQRRTYPDQRRIYAELEQALSIPDTVARLERFLQFSDEQERFRREKKLQLLVVLLAVPALISTASELVQAWGVAMSKDSRSLVESAPKIGESLWVTIGFLAASFVVLALVLGLATYVVYLGWYGYRRVISR